MSDMKLDMRRASGLLLLALCGCCPAQPANINELGCSHTVCLGMARRRIDHARSASRRCREVSGDGRTHRGAVPAEADPTNVSVTRTNSSAGGSSFIAIGGKVDQERTMWINFDVTEMARGNSDDINTARYPARYVLSWCLWLRRRASSESSVLQDLEVSHVSHTDGGHPAAQWLPGERVRGGEPAAQLVVKVSGCGDADAVGK